MNKCPRCCGPMVQLFMSWACKDECDLKPTSAAASVKGYTWDPGKDQWAAIACDTTTGPVTLMLPPSTGSAYVEVLHAAGDHPLTIGYAESEGTYLLSKHHSTTWYADGGGGWVRIS